MEWKRVWLQVQKDPALRALHREFSPPLRAAIRAQRAIRQMTPRATTFAHWTSATTSPMTRQSQKQTA